MQKGAAVNAKWMNATKSDKVVQSKGSTLLSLSNYFHFLSRQIKRIEAEQLYFHFLTRKENNREFRFNFYLLFKTKQ